MGIPLISPLSRGWERMKGMLFQPMDAGKWLVVAFSAWLAGLAGGNGNAGLSYNVDSSDKVVEAGQSGWEELIGGAMLSWFVVVALLFALALAAVLLWVSSRAKFIFLDNVVHDRGQIVEPWGRYRSLGNSLFLFRLVACIVAVPVVLIPVGLGVLAGVGLWGWNEPGGMVAGGIALALLMALLIAAVCYLFFFLDAFVVPIMYRYEIGVMEAWKRFSTLLSGRTASFLASGLFVFALALVACSLAIAFGFLTCCVGWILLALPYIGTVILLPLVVTYRAFTLEYLAQVDPDLALFPAAEAAA